MKKVFILILTLLTVAMFGLSGCHNKVYHWEFNYDTAEIKEIKIVEIVCSAPLEYETIKEIDLELAEEICNDISKLEMKKYGTNLASHSGKCFLIVFNNGEYDLISRKEPSHFKFADSMLVGYTSWMCFDENEFSFLIDKYLNQ